MDFILIFWKVGYDFIGLYYFSHALALNTSAGRGGGQNVSIVEIVITCLNFDDRL